MDDKDQNAREEYKWSDHPPTQYQAVASAKPSEKTSIQKGEQVVGSKNQHDKKVKSIIDAYTLLYEVRMQNLIFDQWRTPLEYIVSNAKGSYEAAQA